jgi:hypothetical protein
MNYFNVNNVYAGSKGKPAGIMPKEIRVKLKDAPFKVQLFKVDATNGNIDWVITNCLDKALPMQATQDASACAGRSKNCIADSTIEWN